VKKRILGLWQFFFLLSLLLFASGFIQQFWLNNLFLHVCHPLPHPSSMFLQ
jgi:hypothetical protein